MTLPSSTPGRAVTLEDCATVSRRLGDVLEANEAVSGSYLLEVSSPGLDRPLKRPEDFARFAGQKASVKLRLPLQGRRQYITARLHGRRQR